MRPFYAFARASFGYLLAGLWLLVPQDVRAQSKNGKLAAETLFRDARRLSEEGNYEEACKKLALSQRLDPAPGTALNLGRCYEAIGRTAGAWEQFREASALARTAGQPERAARASELADALEASLPRLAIHVEDAKYRRAQQVKRDGEIIAPETWGVAVPVDPGVHFLEASAPGCVTWKGKLTLVAGKARTVTVPALAFTEAAPPDQIDSSPDSDGGASASSTDSGEFWNGQRVAGAMLGLAGLTGMVVGFTVLDTSRSYDAITGQVRDDGNGGSRLALIGLGAVATATGVVLFAAAGPKSHATGVAITPYAGPGGASLRLTGAF